MHTTVIANNKGGVGKSELTVQLAAALARAKKRVLVVDLDPQGNASRRLGVAWDSTDPTPTMSEVIKANEVGAGAGAVVQCGWVEDDEPTEEAQNIDVLPSRFDLLNRESEAGTVGAVRRVKKALEGFGDQYDVVLIDTRPDLGHLVQMAFAAADTVLVPTDPNFDGVEGAIRVADFISEHAEDLSNPKLDVGGVIVTRRKVTAEHDFQLEGIRTQFGDKVWKFGGVKKDSAGDETLVPNEIPEWSRFSEADSAGVSLAAWNDRRARSTVAIFDAIATEYIKRFLTESKG
ncbi:ParA family protein [Lysinibacter cavernae]|uniref:ParA family protein n=1 Tax=Lysinibacter cavernae TaxID=1640652 RepID=UPI0036160745